MQCPQLVWLAQRGTGEVGDTSTMLRSERPASARDSRTRASVACSSVSINGDVPGGNGVVYDVTYFGGEKAVLLRGSADVMHGGTGCAVWQGSLVLASLLLASSVSSAVLRSNNNQSSPARSPARSN